MLELEQVEVRFGGVHALRGVSLSARKDEVVALIGPNGAGKSTALKAAAGVNKPSAGRVVYDGQDITAWAPPAVVRTGVSLIPQGRRLFSSMSVRDNIEMGAYVKADRKAVAADLEHWASFFPEVGSNLDKRAAELSGGQQQIVAFVRGLMSRPSMLMLDEPSIGVAPPIADKIGREIRRLNDEAGVGIVIVEQNVKLAFDVADRVVVLAQGRDVHTGTPDELRDPDVLAAHFFGAAAGVTKAATA
jgi:branched-chain amino acid transport system ATP-binding protein